ncbi:CopG family transcriptional regulator [Haloferula sargassicola]|uniref:Ribbon-helix-helix protein CopG domain-containing protein n=1 Tax=Haloferula sargassicola TaxID=490096 RepID=A0ABP9UR66_9BACT
MKRTIVDLEQDSIKALDDIASDSDTSRASVMREAVAEYIVRHKDSTHRAPVPLEGFGSLHGRLGDGLAYQQDLRSEWD